MKIAAPPSVTMANAAAANVQGGAAANAVAGDVSSQGAQEESPVPVSECPKLKEQKCPPCVPPVDTKCYRVDRTHSHFPCPSDHVHFKKRTQVPAFAKNPGVRCQCQWKDLESEIVCLNQGEAYTPPPGVIPQPPGV